MPVLRLIRERFERERPLDGLRIAACLHVTTETANLMRTLKAGGAPVVAVRIQSALDAGRDGGRARGGVRDLRLRPPRRRPDTYYSHLSAAAETHPQMTMDDGCDLVTLIHQDRRGQLTEIFAGTEETTTGVIRLKSMAAAGALGYPVVAVNEALTKHLFDNRYGTGQSTVDGIMRATNLLIAGRHVVVAGYGWCGKGIAAALPGHGRAGLRGRGGPGPRPRGADGRQPGHDRSARPRPGARSSSPPPATSTSSGAEHFEVMRDGAIMANSGHFDVELDMPALRDARRRPHPRSPRPTSSSTIVGRQAPPRPGRRPAREPERGRRPPRLGHGHELRQPGPLRRVRLGYSTAELADGVYDVPEAIDVEVARLKLAAARHHPRSAHPRAGRLRRFLAQRHVGAPGRASGLAVWLRGLRLGGLGPPRL